MKQLTFFLMGFIIFFSLLIFLRLGVKLIVWMINIWYVALPVLGLLLYFLLSKKGKHKQSRTRKRTDLDPTKEIKLYDEPEIKDWDKESNNEDGGKD